MSKNKTFFSAKAIACFFIICIHIQFQGNIGNIVLNFARFAVPLFFMISGFFTYYTDKDKMDKTLNKRLKALGILTLVSFIAYFVLNIIITRKNLMFDSWITGMKTPEKIFKFVFLNWTTPYIGVGHLWYLFAILYVYFILKFVNKFNLYKPSYVFSFVAIIGVYIFEIINYKKQLGIAEIWFRNAWLFGFPYFMLGHFFRKYELKLKFSNKKLLVISIISIIIIAVGFYFETKIIKENICLFASNIMLDIFIFILAINKPNINFFSKLGELDFGNIYVIHYAIIVIINNYYIWRMGANMQKILPIIVFVISYAISIIFRKLDFLRRKCIERVRGNRSIMS